MRPEVTTLANGARLARLPHANASGWVGLGLWWRAGSRFETDAEAGWGHLLEHLWFRGGRRHDAAAVDMLCDRFGGQVNAETGRELAGLWGLAPAGAADDLAGLLTDVFLTPTFDDTAVATERALVLAELDALAADPLAATVTRALGAIWRDHPLGRSVEGAPAVLAAADAPALHAWHRRHLTGGRLVATSVGPWPEATRRGLADALAAIPPGGSPGTVPPGPAVPPTPAPLPEGGAGLLWAVPLPGWCEPGHAAARLAVRALGGGLSALLPARLRREAGLVYDVRATIETAFDAAAALIEAEARDARRTAAAVEAVLDTVAASGVPGDALETARAAEAAAAALAGATPVDAMRRAAWAALGGALPGADPEADAVGGAAAAFAGHGRWRWFTTPTANA